MAASSADESGGRLDLHPLAGFLPDVPEMQGVFVPAVPLGQLHRNRITIWKLLL
jgi:hypothetical protein